MNAPKFWQKKKLISYLLLPISILYQIGYFVKIIFQLIFYKKDKQNIKTICIANLTIGGAGKTPVAINIGQKLKNINIDFVYLSKGYGGKIKNLTKLNNDHNIIDVGDEALLLKEINDSFICKKITSKILQNQNFLRKDLLIIDDGFQNFAWKKDFSILVIDGEYGFGNEMTFPSGPLRECIKFGINRSDIIIIIGEDKKNIKDRFVKDKKVIKANIKIINGDDFKNKKVIAFCGIARPEKFFNSLKDSGANIKYQFSFSDHYNYKEKDINKLLKLSKETNLQLVTTKKDWVRIDKKYQDQIQILDIEIEMDEEINFDDLLL